MVICGVVGGVICCVIVGVVCMVICAVICGVVCMFICGVAAGDECVECFVAHCQIYRNTGEGSPARDQVLL